MAVSNLILDHMNEWIFIIKLHSYPISKWGNNKNQNQLHVLIFFSDCADSATDEFAFVIIICTNVPRQKKAERERKRVKSVEVMRRERPRQI